MTTEKSDNVGQTAESDDDMNTEQSEEDNGYLLRTPRTRSARKLRMARAVYGSIQQGDNDGLRVTTDSLRLPTRSGRQPLPESKSFPTFQARASMLAVMFCYEMNQYVSSPLLAQYFHSRFEPEFFNDTSSTASGRVVSKCSTNSSGLLARQESALQERAAAFQLYTTYPRTALMVAVTIVLGSLSDVIGRRSLFLLPCTSALVKQVIILVTMQLDLPMWLFYVANVVDGMSGSYCTLLLAAFAYTADLTPPEKARTSGIAVVEFVMSAAGVGSRLAVGYVLQDLGFFYGTLGPTAFVGFSVLIGFFCLPETVPAQKRGIFSQCVNPVKHLKNVFRFYLSDGTVRDRVKFWLPLMALLVAWICSMSSESVLTLFQLNLPFCWDPEQVGVFGATSTGLRSAVMLVGVHILQKCLSDQAMAAASYISSAGMYVTIALAQNDVTLYLALVAGCMANIATPINRGLLSKMAGSHRQGALFASIALMETVSTLISTTMYNSIYEATVAQMRGAVFLVVASLLVVPVLLVLILGLISRTEQQTYEKIVTATSSESSM